MILHWEFPQTKCVEFFKKRFITPAFLTLFIDTIASQQTINSFTTSSTFGWNLDMHFPKERSPLFSSMLAVTAPQGQQHPEAESVECPQVGQARQASRAWPVACQKQGARGTGTASNSLYVKPDRSFCCKPGVLPQLSALYDGLSAFGKSCLWFNKKILIQLPKP